MQANIFRHQYVAGMELVLQHRKHVQAATLASTINVWMAWVVSIHPKPAMMAYFVPLIHAQEVTATTAHPTPCAMTP